MSDHAVAEVHGHTDHETPAGDGLRFEKSELDYFVEDDRYCGRAIGKLLAFFFCILLTLMGGVALWTNYNQFYSQDPHDVPTMKIRSFDH